jgi:hemoglobin-like flavoprotein
MSEKLESDDVSETSITLDEWSVTSASETAVEAVRTTASVNSNSIFAQSILERVIHSWELISPHQDAVGMDFFIRVFTEHPPLLKLFPFFGDKMLLELQEYNQQQQQQSSSSCATAAKNKLRSCVQLQAHASSVMAFIGRGVAGISDIEGLIPDLRSLGKTHVRAGVSSAHYDMFFRNLMAAFKAELGDHQWDEETAEAWATVYHGMTAVMDEPDTLHQTEPLAGWGLGIAVASAWIAFVSPWRLAGFSAQFPALVTLLLDAMEIVCFLILAMDGASPYILQRLRSEKAFSTKLQNLTPWKFRVFRAIHSLHLERWVSWQKLDAVILLSYFWQNLTTLSSSFTLYSQQLGVSWLHLFGLVRIAAIFRVLYFCRCAENGAILQRATSQHWRTTVTVSYLLVTLTYVTHVAACLWFIVARVELGYGTTTIDEPSEFFPDSSLLLGQKTSWLVCYIRAVYWAWVNLAGNGNVESVPTQPLEICATLLVHFCGASLYAIVTGHVVSILEELTQKENRVGNDLAELREFMDECELPSSEQERIMHGYIVQNLMRSEGSLTVVPDLKEDVGQRLPSHYRKDLELHAYAVALRRRNPLLERCSADFLFALASSLRGQLTLLPGDYLLQAGNRPTRKFYMVQKGELEIIKIGDESVATLQRGHAIGIGWLLDATLPEESKKPLPEPGDLSDWLSPDGVAGVSIRATTNCIIDSGLASALEIEGLRRRFPQDMDMLEAERNSILERIRKKRTLRGVARTIINLNKKIE